MIMLKMHVCGGRSEWSCLPAAEVAILVTRDLSMTDADNFLRADLRESSWALTVRWECEFLILIWMQETTAFPNKANI